MGQDRTSNKPRLLDQIRPICQQKYYSSRTADTYVFWAKQFIIFHHKKHPKDMGKTEIEAFLNDLAIRRRVSPSTQATALNAIVFLYKSVLELPFEDLDGFHRAKRQPNVPVILSVTEIKRLFDAIHSTNRLLAELIYGTVLRIGECVVLRLKDIDFDNHQITVRAGKGNKDCATLSP